MGRKHLPSLLCIVLLATSISLWANPLVTDRRDGNTGSPIELFTGSPESGIQNDDSSLFGPSQWGAPSPQNTSTIDSSDGFVFGNLPLLSTRLISSDLPVQLGILFEGCSVGPECLTEVGLMLSF
jgi:hypothetical protein